MGREVDLVHDQKVRARHPRPLLARDVLPRRRVDHVKRQVGQFRREGRGEVVAARFDEHHVEIGNARPELRHGGEVDRGILPDRGMRAAAGLDPPDAIGGQACARNRYSASSAV
jgi:hypothetical protein